MPSYDFLQFTEGLYSDVSIHLVPDGERQSGAGGALWAMSNVNTSYKLGSIFKRPGYEQINSASVESGKAITGLHNFRQNASTQKILVTVNDSTDDDTQLFYDNSGTWTEITGAETAWANKASINVEMEDFIEYCFFVGWGSTDGFLPPASLTGTTFSTSTNVTDMPNAKFIKRWRDRLYIGNTDISGTATPYRVYYSSVPSAGAITWDTSTQFFDIDYSEEVTGLGENWDRLMVFTEYSAYMVSAISPLTRKKIWDVGCSNHRTIRNSGVYMIWANRDGVFMSASGSFPTNVAGRVIDFIRFADMTTAFAEVVDEEYHLYLGAVTVNGISYTNTTVILNIPTMTWRVHEYADTFNIFARFYSSGEDFLYMGTNDGDVERLGKYTDTTLLTDDAGTKIDSWFQTGAIDLGAPGTVKSWNKLFAYADRAQGLQLKARVIDANNQGVSKWEPLAELRKYITETQILPEKGHFLQIEGVESGSNEYWSLFGWTIQADIDVTLSK